MGLKHKKKLILWYALIILIIPVLAYVASVAINDQTKATTATANDVIPMYEDTAAAGRGITADNLATSLAALMDEGDLADSIVVSADIKDDTIDSADYAAGSIDAEHLAADIIDFVHVWVRIGCSILPERYLFRLDRLSLNRLKLRAKISWPFIASH
jgi:hypothetical protein